LKTKDVYYVSGSTGILAKNMGKALLGQFPEINFHEESFPFIRTEDEARAVLKKILQRSSENSPLVFSTLFFKELNAIFDTPEVDFFNIFDYFLGNLESLLEEKALREPGFSRHLDDTLIAKRVNAIQYTISHDDGIGTKDYDQADILLVGVSRAGKTPVSVYLATQMGLKTANYPLVDEDLKGFKLPQDVVRNIQRVVGLSTTPQMLHVFRESRYKGSRYAEMSTCSKEIKEAREIFLKYNVPVIYTEGKSIEETATQITQELKLNIVTTF
jgi:[pyruvate, water dikinase]-phosphate phosphotransferase / [pyruvate, water dikinase] kinase